MKLRTFLLTGLVAALLIAGVASYYASSHPDGLEFVAGETGFLDSAEEHGAADGPLADYQAKGIDDERLSGGVAGVLGSLAVLASAAGCSGSSAVAATTTHAPRQHADSH